MRADQAPIQHRPTDWEAIAPKPAEVIRDVRGTVWDLGFSLLIVTWSGREVWTGQDLEHTKAVLSKLPKPPQAIQLSLPFADHPGSQPSPAALPSV